MVKFNVSDFTNWFTTFVGRYHVSTPGWKLCLISRHCLQAKIWKKLTKAQRRAWFKGILKAHQDNRKLFQDVMSGRLGGR
jgi:hypothetical protein